MKSLTAVTLILSFILSTIFSISAQSFMDRVKKVSEDLDPEEIPFKFINATDQPVFKIIVNHQLTGKEIKFDKGIEAGEEATFNVLSGKSDLAFIYFVNGSKLKVVDVKNTTIKGEDAWMKFEDPDWSRYKDYQVDNLPPKVHECTKKIDENADGKYESLVHFEKMKSYDVYFSKFDDNADGKIDRRISTNYNKSGRGVGTKWDTNGDGTWDSIHTRLYKGSAFIAQKEIIVYKGDTVWVLKNIVDPNQKMNLIRQEWDIDNDSNVDKIRHLTRDKNSTIITEEWDYNADGNIDERTVYEPHPDKSYLTLKKKKDNDADGKWDQITVFEYDENDFRNKVSYDLDGDEKWEKIEFIRGTKREHEFTEVDLDGDGTIDKVFGSKFENDRVKRSYVDKNNDGTKDEEVIYSYDLVGNLSKETYDFDGDGKPDKIVKYDRSCHEGYDEKGPIISF